LVAKACWIGVVGGFGVRGRNVSALATGMATAGHACATLVKEHSLTKLATAGQAARANAPDIADENQQKNSQFSTSLKAIGNLAAASVH